jgi:hypothetical protein
LGRSVEIAPEANPSAKLAAKGITSASKREHVPLPGRNVIRVPSVAIDGDAV